MCIILCVLLVLLITFFAYFCSRQSMQFRGSYSTSVLLTDEKENLYLLDILVLIKGEREKF